MLLAEEIRGRDEATRGIRRGAFVSATMTKPFRGRIVLAEPRQPGTVLWECDHDHASFPEAFQCAGEEIGRNGMT